MRRLTAMQEEQIRAWREAALERYHVDPLFHARVKAAAQLIAAVHPSPVPDDPNAAHHQALETALVVLAALDAWGGKP